MPATINIGLAVHGGGAVNPDRALALIHSVGGVRPKARAVHLSDTEPTLVVETDRPMFPLAASEVARHLRQDAIAQHDGRDGQLYGPNAGAWGTFDPTLFLTLDGRRLAQPVEQRIAA